MKRSYGLIYKLSMVLSLLSFLGCNIKGAYNPFTYAPMSPDSIWMPSCKAQTRLISDEAQQKNACDCSLLSEEKPLTLAEIIDITLSCNPTTKSSWANARVSAAEYGQSLQNLFIQAEIEGTHSRTRSAEFIGRKRSVIYETTSDWQLELSYLLLDFGQTKATSKAALQSLYYANWLHNSKIQLVIQMAMNNYYNYLYQKALLEAHKEDVLNAEISLEATKESFQRGLSDISDIVQAKTSFLKQQLNLISQEQNVHDAYTQLIQSMGLPNNKPIFFQNYPKEIHPIDIEPLDILLAQAHQNRPDLLAAEAQVTSSLFSLDSAKRKNYPTVNAEFDVGRKWLRHHGNDHYDFTALLSLTFPLFQGFYIENSIKKAKANLEIAEANLRQTQLDITEEVSNYRESLLLSLKMIKYAKSYLNSAKQDFEVNLSKYRAGTTTIVELISAQTATADARAEVAKAQNSFYTSIANLAYATGILLSPSLKKECGEEM